MLRILGGRYEVEAAGPGERDEPRLLTCTLRGRLKQDDDEKIAVGDRVEVEELDEGSCRISGLLPRSTMLSRRGAAGRREQPIVANVDQLAVVCAVDRPPPDRQLLDRLLVLAEINRLPAFLVVNKVDLLDESGEEHDPEIRAKVNDLLVEYADAGYDLLPTSAVTGYRLHRLDARLAGRSTVLAGASGVGKSTLLNALVPGLQQRVGEVGRKGRHTTVAAALFRYDGDGYVADTPGLQYLAIWELEPAELSRAFPELRPHLAECRFTNCRHAEEPGCAVKEALESGGIPRRRYRSYRKLLEEAEEAGDEHR